MSIIQHMLISTLLVSVETIFRQGLNFKIKFIFGYLDRDYKKNMLICINIWRIQLRFFGYLGLLLGVL